MIDAIIGVMLYTHHFHPKEETNNETTGLYVSMDARVCNPGGGVFINSMHRWSSFVACEFVAGNFSVTVGGITGYDRAVIPLVSPSVRLPLWDRSYFRISYIPKPPETHRSGGLTFSIERKF